MGSTEPERMERTFGPQGKGNENPAETSYPPDSLLQVRIWANPTQPPILNRLRALYLGYKRGVPKSEGDKRQTTANTREPKIQGRPCLAQKQINENRFIYVEGKIKNSRQVRVQ